MATYKIQMTNQCLKSKGQILELGLWISFDIWALKFELYR